MVLGLAFEFGSGYRTAHRSSYFKTYSTTSHDAVRIMQSVCHSSGGFPVA